MEEVLDFHELDEYQGELLKRFERVYPEETKKFVRKQTNKAGNAYKAKLPKGKTGNLRKGAGKNTKNFNGHFVGMVYNTAPHAHLYEDGHMNVDGSTTPGKHALYITMVQEAPHIDSEIDAFIDRMCDF